MARNKYIVISTSHSQYRRAITSLTRAYATLGATFAPVVRGTWAIFQVKGAVEKVTHILRDADATIVKFKEAEEARENLVSR